METVQTIAEPVIAILILIGAILGALSAFGLIRLPDVYLRAHAATKSATLGVLCVLGGGFLYFVFFERLISAKMLLGIVFVFITAPVAGHLIERAAYMSGVPMWQKSVRDDLKMAIAEERKSRPQTEKSQA